MRPFRHRLSRNRKDTLSSFPSSSLLPLFSTFHQPPLRNWQKLLFNSKYFINMFSLRFVILIVSSLLIPSTLCVSQGVTENIRPPGTSPPGCIDSYPDTIGVQFVDYPTPGVETQCIHERSLRMLLENGLLTDHLGRIGSIAANRKFQFDGPPAKAGAIYTAGWSLCSDNLLALGPQRQFYACASGDCKLPKNFKKKGGVDILTHVQLTMSTTRWLQTIAGRHF